MTRREKLKSLLKLAESDQHGVFYTFQSGITNYDTSERHMVGREGKPVDTKSLYGLGPEHKESTPTNAHLSRTLSTRYVPNRPGVMARRVEDGVTQDPYTNEIYDWNSGFKTKGDKPEVFTGGSVSLQSQLKSFGKHLEGIGLVKEAKFLDEIISQLKK